MTARQRPVRTEYPPPPLSRNLRAFTTPDDAAYPFGGTGALAPARFPERRYRQTRSVCLRDSGAVAPSAANVFLLRRARALPRRQRLERCCDAVQQPSQSAKVVTPAKAGISGGEYGMRSQLSLG